MGDARSIAHVDCGLIAPNAKWLLPKRLAFLYQGLKEIIEQYHPEEAGFENVFYAKNVRSAMVLGHARAATRTWRRNTRITEFPDSPAQIKQAVCGYGRAEEPVGRMVMALRLPEQAQVDAADALACAICHCNSYRLQRKLKAP